MSTHAVRRCGLSTAQLARLDHACRIIDAAFGEPPYLVGSANDRNDFRDVDVRLILADAEFDAMFGGREQFWGLFCLAVTYYLAEVSGLPVDFQVQRRTEANEKHKGMRNPLGLLHKVRFAGGGDATMFAAMSDAVTGAPTDERLREALLRAISIIHDFSSGAPMPKGERPCKPLHAALGGDNGEWCDIGSKVGAFTDRQPAGAALTGEEE